MDWNQSLWYNYTEYYWLTVNCTSEIWSNSPQGSIFDGWCKRWSGINLPLPHLVGQLAGIHGKSCKRKTNKTDLTTVFKLESKCAVVLQGDDRLNAHKALWSHQAKKKKKVWLCMFPAHIVNDNKLDLT